MTLAVLTKAFVDYKNDASDGPEAFACDPARCGFISTSLRHAGTGMTATATIRLRKLTVDGSAYRVRQVRGHMGDFYNSLLLH